MTTANPLPKLPDIDDVEPASDTDQQCIDEVRAVLSRHGALQRFGLTLLHEHFDVADDEILVEEIDVENRTLTSRPQKVTDVGNSVATAWRLDEPTDIGRCITRCARKHADFRGRGGVHVRSHNREK
ncbi:hypothetical protein AB0I10_31820 [Streptomyces sp. NPDC050636]|uniref:hypothetical protein n=1 Tax=Streptomyces sp. NPDC050636 TaxID=3154510 RepID=UPI0034465983